MINTSNISQSERAARTAANRKAHLRAKLRKARARQAAAAAAAVHAPPQPRDETKPRQDMLVREAELKAVLQAQAAEKAAASLAREAELKAILQSRVAEAQAGNFSFAKLSEICDLITNETKQQDERQEALIADTLAALAAVTLDDKHSRALADDSSSGHKA